MIGDLMFERMSRGWSLTKLSFRVLKLDKEILALPILSGITLVLLTLSFFVPLGVVVGPERLEQLGGAVWLLVFAFYVLAYFVTIFFNAAVVECAMIRFNGGDPVVRDGLRKAWERKGRIFQWAVLAATVGLILKMLENAARQSNNPLANIGAHFAIMLAGAAWNIATYFVVPALVYQDLGPFDALKSSAGTWKRAWGETFIAHFATGFVFFLLGLLGIVPIFLGAASGSAAIMLTMVGAAVLYWVLLAAASGAVGGIVVAALYKYAVDGKLPDLFQEAPVPTTGGPGGRPARY